MKDDTAERPFTDQELDDKIADALEAIIVDLDKVLAMLQRTDGGAS